MQNTKLTSRELYNSLPDFDRYLVDEGYLSIIDGQLNMQPKEECKLSFQMLKQGFTEKLKRERKDGQKR